MRKILTIDCWNTLIKPSGDKERVIYEMSQDLGVPFARLWEAVEQVKKEIQEIHHTVSNYMFWFRVKNVLNLSISTPNLLYVANCRYESYKPVTINAQMWATVVNKALEVGYEVRILSNTGYLKSEWLESQIHVQFDFSKAVPVIGSDMVGAAKPELEFYRRALDCNYSPEEDRWIHIGDNVKLDLEPVAAMGGTAILFTGWDTFDDMDLDKLFI